MKTRYFFLLLFSLFFVTGISAQSIMVDGTVEVETSDDDFSMFEYDKYIVIYTFMQEKDANEAMTLLMSDPNRNITFAFSRKAPNKFGEFSVEVDRGGCMLVWSKDKRYESKVLNRRSISDGMRVKLYLKGSDENKEDKNEVRVLDTLGRKDRIDKEELKKKGIEITGKRENRRESVSQSTEEGGVMTSINYFSIPYRVRKNTRVVVQPLWYDRVDYTDDRSDTVFSYGKVVYCDRTEYGMTQTRLMDYDNMRDELQRYESSIKDRRKFSIVGDSLRTDTLMSRITFSENFDTIHVYLLDTLTGYDPDGSHPYPFGAKVAIGDYNTIVKTHEEKDEGERRNPLKFLDFSFKEFLPNKDDFYEKIDDERQENEASLHLNFLVGRAEIAPNDSASRAQLNEVRETFHEITNDPTGRRGLIGVSVYGMASPEGNLASNKDLARRRAQYAVNEIRKFTSRNVKMEEPQVAGWDKVAAFLKADSLFDEAKEVEAIIVANPGSIEKQNQQIYKLPYYSLIKDKYLPKLRTVQYKYMVNFFGEPKPEVVLARYKANKKAEFTRGEYWTLFNYVTDPAELEEVAKYALQMTRNTYDEDSVYCKGYWPYAACLLACCYIARDTVDLNVLAPFLYLETAKNDTTGLDEVQFLRRKSISQIRRPRIVEYINFPEVAANQLIMVLKQHNSPLRSKIGALEAIMARQGPQYDTIAAISKCIRGGYIVGNVSRTEEEAAEVRSYVASTSVTNSVVINLAADNPDDKSDDDKYLSVALKECELLPDNAVSDYLKAVAYFRSGKQSVADSLLASAFIKDLKLVSTANNDRDLKATGNSDYKVIQGALRNWKNIMASDSTLTDSHPFTLYSSALDELAKGDKADVEAAKATMHKAFDTDERYISVLNVSFKNDKDIAKNKELVEILKEIRNEYKRAE